MQQINELGQWIREQWAVLIFGLSIIVSAVLYRLNLLFPTRKEFNAMGKRVTGLETRMADTETQTAGQARDINELRKYGTEPSQKVLAKVTTMELDIREIKTLLRRNGGK